MCIEAGRGPGNRGPCAAGRRRLRGKYRLLSAAWLPYVIASDQAGTFRRPDYLKCSSVRRRSSIAPNCPPPSPRGIRQKPLAK